MNIYFQTKNIEVHDEVKQKIANRLKGLQKFFSWDTKAYIDLKRTNTSHHGHDLYYASVRIDAPEHEYFAEEYKENIHLAFDHAYGDIFRIIRSHRSKSRNLARRARTKIKSLFKKH